jgi:hypothetical protein
MCKIECAHPNRCGYSTACNLEEMGYPIGRNSRLDATKKGKELI